MSAPLLDPYAEAPRRAKSGRGWAVAVAVLGLLVVVEGAAVATLSHRLIEAERARDSESDGESEAARPPRPAQQPVASGVVGPRPPPPPLPPGLSADETRTIEIFRRSSPAVVYITTLHVANLPFSVDALAIPRGTGSGFVWDTQGHIVTNFHVINDGNAARVTLDDQSKWEAKLVGSAPEKDIAVLRIQAPADRLQPLPRGTSGNLVVGQFALAIGNPFGLDHTLSTGVISGLGREIKALNGTPITGVVQTDAAINPGNSGGPLLDSSGRLIGINTAIFSPSGASAGIGFAVPVDTVNRIVPQLIQHGKVIRPGLGIQIADEAMAARIGLDGVLVLGLIEGGGAEKAGIVPTRRDGGDVVLGDLIVALEGTPVKTPGDLYRVLDTKKVGDTVTVTVQRGSRRLDVQIELAPIDE